MSFGELISPNWSEPHFNYWHDLWTSIPRDELYYRMNYPHKGDVLSAHGAMFLAHTVALKGAGSVSPNPLVGAVLLDKDYGFLAAGAHLKVGGDHAEVHVFKQVSQELILGSHLFVTLEPCAHQGRTPSCAKMLASSHISSVSIGAIDPFVQVNGQGIEILKRANLAVRIMDEWTPISRRLAKVFFHNQIKREVYVGLKVASTLEGVFAGVGSRRLWITCERARNFGHFLRLEYDAIVVGPNTVKLDDPALNIRHPHIAGRTPLRVVLDPAGEIVKNINSYKVFDPHLGPSLIVCPKELELNQIFPEGVSFIKLPLNDLNQFDWKQISASLWDMGIRSLLIEGGGGLYRSALDSGLVNEIHWFVAPETNIRGLRWIVPDKLLELAKNDIGIFLDKDKLIEMVLKSA